MRSVVETSAFIGDGRSELRRYPNMTTRAACPDDSKPKE
jgi:hypothetical protein